jgi:hypothetical protein
MCHAESVNNKQNMTRQTRTVWLTNKQEIICYEMCTVEHVIKETKT